MMLLMMMFFSSLQVEDRLKFFDTGEAPKKNLDVMREGVEANATATAKVRLKRWQTDFHGIES